mgnify:CR=1 FL=1
MKLINKCYYYTLHRNKNNLIKLIQFHKSQGSLATLTATRPPGRYGVIKFGENYRVERFQEKPEGDGSWINGGYFVLKPEVLNLIEGDQSSWEGEPLSRLAKDGQLGAFKHEGFWQPMDTLREKNHLDSLYKENKAPWKTW